MTVDGPAAEFDEGADAWRPLPGLVAPSYGIYAVAAAGPAARTGPGTRAGTGAAAEGVYVGGDVVVDGDGTGAANIARWDGASWRTVAGGRSQPVWAIAVYEGAVIVGDGATSYRGTMARSNGSSSDRGASEDEDNHDDAWEAIAAVNPVALCRYGTLLALAGDFEEVAGVAAARVAFWDGQVFTPAGDGMNLIVWALTVFRGALVAAGRFNRAGGVEANRLAFWEDGAWTAPAGGMRGNSDSIQALAAYNDTALFVGGFFNVIEDASGQRIQAANVAQWDGVQWRPLGPGLDANVRALAMLGPLLVAGGGFSRFAATWDGAAWTPIPGLVDFVAALAVHCATHFQGEPDCDACTPGRYGPDCDLLCADCAANGYGECTEGPTGSCRCAPGRAGPTCADCAADYYGPACVPCAPCEQNGGLCAPGTGGSCTCPVHRDGAQCADCAPDHFGPSCLRCADCAEHGTCVPGVAGNCTCHPEWAGAVCDQCAAGRYGPTCLPCAECGGGCTEGRQGGACTCAPGWDEPPACAVCAAGFYGANCTWTCAACELYGGVCTEGRDGACACAPGWTGETCQACAPGHYGANCTPCALCDASDGSIACIAGLNGTCVCSPGWGGLTCSACAAGRYGPACQYRCSTCEQHGECTGSACVCDPEWDGPQCDECRDGYHGRNCLPCPDDRCMCSIGDCANDGVCEIDLDLGVSRCVCYPGYTGDYCETPTGCRDENATCLNGGTCNPVNGDGAASEVRCYCLPAYTGARCELPAPATFDIVTTIIVPSAVVATAVVLYLTAVWHERARLRDAAAAALVVALDDGDDEADHPDGSTPGRADGPEPGRTAATGDPATTADMPPAANGVVVSVVLVLFGFLSNALFVESIWAADDLVQATVRIAALASLVVPVVLNAALSSWFLWAQMRRVYVHAPGTYAWFHRTGNGTAVVAAWALALMNVEILAVLDSHVYGLDCASAPWVDRGAAHEWLRHGALGTLLLTDIPQLVLQAYVLFNLPRTTTTVIAITSSSLSVLHSVLSHVYAQWLVDPGLDRRPLGANKAQRAARAVVGGDDDGRSSEDGDDCASPPGDSDDEYVAVPDDVSAILFPPVPSRRGGDS